LTVSQWPGRYARQLASRVLRCAGEQWYLVRATPASGTDLRRVEMLAAFFAPRHSLGQHCLRLDRPEPAPAGPLGISGCQPPGDLLGWLLTPPGARYLRLCLADPALATQLAQVRLLPVAEYDPRSHPLANVPRWSSYRPPFAIRKLVLPARLAELGPLLNGLELRTLARPRSLPALRRQARGAACILDPQWVDDLNPTLSELEAIASECWLLVDLKTTAEVISRATGPDIRLVEYRSANGLMSARVEYADVPTRGLALLDVVPYGSWDGRGRFSLRAIRRSKAWTRYADETAFATVLSSRTPWKSRNGDVLCAARPIGRGEWLASDLPWLVAGRHGPLVAPRLALHLLRMHLGLPIEDQVQYWTRWQDISSLVRDIADLARRYPPLRAVRWAASQPAVAHLGLTLDAAAGRPASHLLLRTGRIDRLDFHGGLPPEPMMIFMKWLAREVREQTAWARRHLAGRTVTWQFDTAEGLKYSANYDAAPAGLAESRRARVVELAAAPLARAAHTASDRMAPFVDNEGFLSDRALDFQRTLVAILLRLIGRGR